MDDRIYFVEHHGKQILLLDYSHANAHEMQLLLEQVRITVAQHARESLLTLADFTGATVDRAVATRIKEVLTLDRPFVKKSAWVGTESIPHALHGKLPQFFAAPDCDVQDAGRGDGLPGGRVVLRCQVSGLRKIPSWGLAIDCMAFPETWH